MKPRHVLNIYDWEKAQMVGNVWKFSRVYFFVSWNFVETLQIKFIVSTFSIFFTSLFNENMNPFSDKPATSNSNRH